MPEPAGRADATEHRPRWSPYAVVLPALACALPFASFLSSNALEDLPLGRVVAYATVLALLVVAAVHGVARLVPGRSLDAVATAASLVVVSFFTYGWWLPAEPVPGRELPTIGAWALVTIGAAVLALRAAHIDVVRTAAVAALGAYVTTLVLSYAVERAGRAAPPIDVDRADPVPDLEGPLPDVYWFVLDEFARDDALLATTGVDSGAHRDALEALGYVVSAGARSSYLFTELSLSTTLSMSLLATDDADVAGGVARYQDLITGRSPVAERFALHGYRRVFAPAGAVGWSTCSLASWDVCIAPDSSGRTLGELELSLVQTTPLAPLDLFEPPHTDPRYVLEQIEALPATERPTFVFAHVLLPHTPFRFDAECAPTDVAGAGTVEDYAAQVLCTQLQVREVATALRAADPDAIVIFQSDHGGALMVDWEGELGDWSDEALVDRLGVQSAMLLPERCRSSVPDDLALVNTFRVVFACIEGTAADLLAYRAFHWTGHRPEQIDEIDPARLIGL